MISKEKLAIMKRYSEKENKKEMTKLLATSKKELIAKINTLKKTKDKLSSLLIKISLYLHNKTCQKHCEMKYDEFLQTNYWKVVKKVKLITNPFCKSCSDIVYDNLHIHHTDYSIRGKELFYMNTLEVLCSYCHAKVHGKEKPYESKQT